ncbi:MAG: hypothetical protein AB8G05_02260 [Oligoflexales bacterium]
MQAAQHQEIQNYLLWLQERGQCWPIVDTLAMVPQVSPVEELATENTIEVELQAAAQPKTQSTTPLFRSAGNEQAPYLGIVDCVKGQKLVFGKERELLIKILSALGIDLKSQFRLLGLETDHCSVPFANYQDYQQQFLELVRTQGPKAVFCFGRMPYRIIMNDPSPFLEKANKPIKIAADTTTIFPLYHLCELMHSPELKKQTWFGLKSFMKDL